MRILLVGTHNDNEIFEELLDSSPSIGELKSITCISAKGEHLSPVDIAKYAERDDFDLVIPTSNSILQAGLSNVLEIFRIPCFGATTVAAFLERDSSGLLSSLILQSLEFGDEIMFENNGGIGTGQCDFFCGIVDQYTYKLLASSSVLNPAMEIIADHILRSFLKYCLDADLVYSGFVNIAYQEKNGVVQVTQVSPSPNASVLRSLIFSQDQDVLRDILDLREITTVMRTPMVVQKKNHASA